MSSLLWTVHCRFQTLFVEVFVVVAGVWIAAKFAGVDHANIGNSLMAGMALAATAWGFAYLGSYVALAFPLLFVARYVVGIYLVKGIFSSSAGEAVMIVIFARIGQMLASLAVKAFVSAQAGAG